MRSETSIMSQVLESSTDIADAAADKRPDTGFQTLRQIRETAFGAVENLLSGNCGLTGLATGFDELDRATGGLQKGELTVIAAVPAMGSTSFAMNIAAKAAIHLNAKVGMFSLELTKLSLLHRMLASEARVPLVMLEHGFLAKEEICKVESALVRLEATRVSIDDTVDISLSELRSRAKRHSEDQGGLDLILVDPLQLVPVVAGSACLGTDEDMAPDLSVISHGLKALAEEFDMPVIATLRLPKLKRKTGAERRPTLNDLRAYGAIGRDADQVLFVHREVYYRVDAELAEADRRKAEIVVAKHRTCPLTTFYMDFNAACMCFNDL